MGETLTGEEGPGRTPERPCGTQLCTSRGKPLSAVRSADLDALYGALLRELSRATVSRFRNTLSSFLGWAVREGLITKNPAIESRVPKGTGRPSKEIYPFNLAELTALHAELTDKQGAELADIFLVLAHSGLRWGELAALRVRDVQLVPTLAFRVTRSRTDGHPVKATKSGKGRTVPVTGPIVEIVTERTKRADPEAPLFPSATGSMRLLANYKRAIQWKANSRGRRIQDLRHTAATLWLSSGVDLKTAQAWLGHSSAKLTADTYAHWLGSDADAAAVARLNSAFAPQGDAGGTRVTKLKAAEGSGN